MTKRKLKVGITLEYQINVICYLIIPEASPVTCNVSQMFSFDFKSVNVFFNTGSHLFFSLVHHFFLIVQKITYSKSKRNEYERQIVNYSKIY